MMKDLMKLLETKMGTMHVLVDDWNRLGWEFFTIPQAHARCVSLTNYTEAKAEGGTVVFTIENNYDGTGLLKVLHIEGSGPHGIAWYDEVINTHSDEPIKLSEQDVEDLAAKLVQECANEAQSSYWSPWRDEKPQRNLLFRERKGDATFEVEVPFNWTDEDWKEATSR